MNWAVTVAGIAGVLIAVLLQRYLRIRIRQMNAGAAAIYEFGQISASLMDRGLPNEAREHLVKLSKIVGSGRLARKLLRELAGGDIDRPTLRAQVETRREIWADHPRESRIEFTRAIFTAVLADSYYADFSGTALRRALFFVKSTPAEIAQAVDAMETKILIVRTLEVSTAAHRNHRSKSGVAHAARA